MMMRQTQVFARDRLNEVQESLYKDKSCSLRVLALLCSLALMVVSILGFVGHILTFHWLEAVFDVYIFLLGLVMLFLEYGKQLGCFGSYYYDETTLYENAKFLQYVWGRGILYFVAGTLCVSQKSLIPIVVGSCVCVVGIVFILTGRSATRKIIQQTKTMDASLLQEQFAISDVDGMGSLNKAQFSNFLGALGLTLTNHEVESAFSQLDVVHKTGRVDYDTVQMWWNKDVLASGPCGGDLVSA
jgi:uncharacterized membrane protein YfcA